jgi:hypothetical protein
VTNKLYYADNLEVLRERLADSPPRIETEFGRFPAIQVVTIAEPIRAPKRKPLL